ncbi:THO complex subunit 2 [Hypsibius exemplaris]|uniref:THO complex subunit 2 n=1 Tax=Hypsibius exemplaris TaxID=2072580 RepID=A0A1W0WG42_HYPEX|nr:THO complex subunit 2 [Hypsibius exemplaris]
MSAAEFSKSTPRNSTVLFRSPSSGVPTTAGRIGESEMDVDGESPASLYQSLSENVGESDLAENFFDDSTDFVEYCGVLIRGVIAGELSRDDCLLRIKPHLDAYPGLASLIIDQLQVVEYSTAESEDAAAAERYSDLVSHIVSKNLVPMADVRERLEQEMLPAVGVVDKVGGWETRYVRTKTKWFFKLQKFNLYREEPEGFAELIDVLDQANSSNCSLIAEKIMELAGTYDLDIYRIIETMLTAICLQPKILSKVLLELCDSMDFDISSLVTLIGAKFQLFGKKNGKEFRRIRGLCQLVCHIVAEGLSTWEDILPYVPLTHEETELHWKQMFERATDEDKILHTTKRSVKESNTEKLSFEAMTQYFEENRNPRIELVTIMLQRGMYHDAIRLINDMPIQYATTFEPLALEISRIVHYIIDPIYRNIGLDAQRIPDPGSNFPLVLNDQLPSQMTNVADMGEKLDPWLMILGGNLIYDRILFSKLLRIAHEFVRLNQVALNEDMAALNADSLKIFRELLHTFEHCFLPGLTRGTGSSSLSEKIFAVMKMLPYTIRFTLYYKTKVDYYPNGHPLGIVARAVALANAKWFQKRINKDSTKSCGRIVAKDMYNNAIIVCNYLSERIGSYDNFGTLVTDAMRNASAFSADIMLYCVLEYMSLPKNNSHKHDAMTIMPWYRYTANFSAVFAKRLTIELEPILEYVAGMLKAGQTVDLLILKELVHKLSGIEVSEGVTDEQLAALAGGEVLKAEGAYFSPMRNTKRSSVRLKDALLNSGQALPLCLLITHVESVILYKEDEAKNLKLVGLLYDMCHDTLVQYGTFLATNLTKSEYEKTFPSLEVLIRVYNIPFETSIFLLRSVYWNEITTEIEHFKKQEKIPDGTLNGEHFKLVQEKFSKTFDNVITSVVDLITPVMTQAPMEDISLRFYVLFWFLSLYDLYVPVAVYEQEVEKLQQVVAAAADPGDEDLGKEIKRRKESTRAQIVIEKLQEEMSVQKQHVQMLRNHLAEEKDRWFQSAKSNKSDVVSQFLQMCVLPRSTFSTIDALFSAHFISSLHELRTQNFSTLLCYDRMLCDITTALTCCSENEASRYGRLLHTVLQTIMRWHNSKAVFETECQHHPGFMTKFRTPTVSSGADVVDHIDYENFRHVCHKWHFKLTKSMVKSLDSDSYVRIRNGLIVLDRILPYYPIISNFYVAIEKRVQQLMESEKEKRPDMYSLAYGYMGRLRAQKQAGHLVLEESFHTRAAGPKKPDSLKTERSKEQTKAETPAEEEIQPASSDSAATAGTSSSDKDAKENVRIKTEVTAKKGEFPAAPKAPVVAAGTNSAKSLKSGAAPTAPKFVEKTSLEGAVVASNKDAPTSKRLKTSSGSPIKTPVEANPTQNGAGGTPAPNSVNGQKSKLTSARDQVEKVSKRLEKNGVKAPEGSGKEAKSKPTPISSPPTAIFSEPETKKSSSSSHPAKLHRTISDSAASSKTTEKQPPPASPKPRSKEKKLETPRSPDSIASTRKVIEFKEKDRVSTSSHSSPTSRRSDHADRSKPSEKRESAISVLSLTSGHSPDVVLAKPSTEKSSKDRHRRRSSVDAISPELRTSKKSLDGGVVHGSGKGGKEKGGGERTHSQEPTGRNDRVAARKESASASRHHSSKGSGLNSHESSREQEKKSASDRSHADAPSPVAVRTASETRPAKRRRDADSAERDRPHRKSSNAH